MTDRELMQQALDALNRSDYLGWQLNIPIIKAMRERLAQPEQEPLTEKRIEELYSFWIVDCQDIVGFARAVERSKPKMQPCAGRNCGSTNPNLHSAECFEDYEKSTGMVQEPVAWVYPEGLEALKSGRPWTAYGSSGEGRIPLYLNDAVARRVEPRSGESGAGFESLPASPKWWDDPVPQMNYRQWQGLTDEERDQFKQWAHPDIIEAIELRLQERNT